MEFSLTTKYSKAVTKYSKAVTKCTKAVTKCIKAVTKCTKAITKDAKYCISVICALCASCLLYVCADRVRIKLWRRVFGKPPAAEGLLKLQAPMLKLQRQRK